MKTVFILAVGAVVVPVVMTLLAPGTCLGEVPGAQPAAESLPAYLQDRGRGIPTSMFGTYVEHGELLFYPFFEYYRDHDAEYSPQDFGFGVPHDFRGRYRASEGLVFVGYGLTEDVSVELEVAVIDATLDRSPDDSSAMPASFSESGLGDVQTQVNFRWLRETEGHPEAFSFVEVVYPLNKDKLLIGTADWEFKVGTGITKGFGWGTMTARAAFEYARAEETTELGEMAIEYFKRLSPAWRAYLGVEGAQDEIELIAEAQWHPSSRMVVKLNSAFGLTSKATDWAPEVGVMFRF
ncbi:MAG: hypothetical protein V2A71_00040 [Candidatus Eisenbacteria bacterium]